MPSWTVYEQQEKARKEREKFGFSDLFDLINTVAGVAGAVKGFKQGDAAQELGEDKLAFAREQADYGVTQDTLADTIRQGETTRGMEGEGYKRVPTLTGGYGDAAKLAQMGAQPPDSIGPAQPIDLGTSYADVEGSWRRPPPEPTEPMPPGMADDYHLYGGKPFRKPGSFGGLGNAGTPYTVPDPNDPSMDIPATAGMAGAWYGHETGYGTPEFWGTDPTTGEPTRVTTGHATQIQNRQAGVDMEDPKARAMSEMRVMDKYLSGSEDDYAMLADLTAKYRVQINVEQYGDSISSQSLIAAGDAGDIDAMGQIVASVLARPDVSPLYASAIDLYFEFMKARASATTER